MTRAFATTRLFVDVNDVIPSLTFDDWTLSTIPDGWTLIPASLADANSDASPGWNITTPGTLAGADLLGVLTAGVRYKYTLTATKVSGSLTFQHGDITGTLVSINTGIIAGTYTGSFIASGTDIRIKRSSACDMTITYLSIKPSR